jgi:UDP-glucose 4-epimerase
LRPSDDVTIIHPQTRPRFAYRPEVHSRYFFVSPFEHDVQRRISSTEKARPVLGFEATTTLDEMLDEVVPWIEDAVERGVI